MFVVLRVDRGAVGLLEMIQWDMCELHFDYVVILSIAFASNRRTVFCAFQETDSIVLRERLTDIARIKRFLLHHQYSRHHLWKIPAH